jgi:DNA-binding GntR family transcriptional regulator
VTDVEERASARTLTTGQRCTLNIAEGVPVLVVARRMLAGPLSDRQPVEVTSLIISTDSTALVDTISLASMPHMDKSRRRRESLTSAQA